MDTDTIWGEEPRGGAGGRPDDVIVNPVRLAVFRAVAERENFSRAAEVLALTQPTVSGHIQALETAFGARLFARHRRGARLTEAGQIVYEFAIALHRELEAARARLDDLAGGERGTVRLGAGMAPGTYVLPDLLARFHLQHPAARIQLQLLSPDAIGDAVLRGHLDFGVVNEAVPLPGLRAEPLWTDEVLTIAPPDHPLAGRSRVTVADLADAPFVVGAYPTIGDRAIDQALGRAGLAPRRIVLQVGNLEGVKQAVLRRAGLGILFRQVVAAELAGGQVVALPLEGPPLAEQFLLISRRATHVAPLVRRLMAFIRAAAREMGDAAPESPG